MGKRKYLKWTEKEINYLKNNYKKEKSEIIIKNLRNRKWHAITKKAEKLCLKRKICKNNLNILLNNSCESFYWIGFLLADGNFESRRISIAVSKKDLNHINKLKKYINSTNEISEVCENYYRVRFGNKEVIKNLRKNFNIKNNKTINPCNIQSIDNKDLLFSLIVGFFDGDGCLTKNKKYESYTFNLVGHPSWIDNFEFMFNFLFNTFDIKITNKKPFIKNVNVILPQNNYKTNHELCTFNITNKELIYKIKEKADELNLPYLDRKLGKIKN